MRHAKNLAVMAVADTAKFEISESHVSPRVNAAFRTHSTPSGGTQEFW
jgi:hypothetical protein